MLNRQAGEYLWELFRHQFFLADDVKTRELVSSLFEFALDFPDSVELLIIDFWKTWNVDYLFDLAKFTVRSYFFHDERHFILLAFLVSTQNLLIYEAKGFLLTPGRSIAKFPPAIQNAINFSWLLKEDADEGFASLGDDELLKKHLSEILKMANDKSWIYEKP